jgi:hypothetical protein
LSGSLAAVAALQSEPLPLTLLLSLICATLPVDLKQIDVLRRSDQIGNFTNLSKMIGLSDKNSTVNVLGYVLAALGCMFFSHSSRPCNLNFMLLIVLNCRSEKSTATKLYLRPINARVLQYCPLPAYLLPYELFCWECHSYVPRLYVSMQTMKKVVILNKC